MNAWSGAALQAALLQLLLVHHIALRLPLRNLWWAVLVVIAPTCVTVARYGDSAGSWNQQVGSQILSVGVATPHRHHRPHPAGLHRGPGGPRPAAWRRNATSRAASPPPPNAPA
ncbi:hypothetical protein LV779_06330 [Streptomyces thinghirensis]|nr:hypothetical protein [Streptomyces thinghirensis]